jgi:drug/metabolite transporter (DMT)-like permease
MSSAAPSASPPAPAPRWALWGSFSVIYLVWGSTFLGIRVAVETLPPLTMAAGRFLIAGAALLALSSRARPRPTLREWGNAALVAALFFLGNHGLVSLAARHLPSSLACLIVSTEVPMIALLSAALLPGQPLTRPGLLGAGLGLAGVGVLFADSGPGGEVSALACAAVLGASLCWSLGAVLSQRLRFPGDAALRAGMQMACGGVMLALASALRGEPWSVSPGEVSLRSLAALGYLIVFGSVLAFGCYSYLLKHVRGDAVATHVFVNPLVAVAVGAWLGGEQLRPIHLLSGALILASVAVVTLGQRRPRAPQERERTRATSAPHGARATEVPVE